MIVCQALDPEIEKIKNLEYGLGAFVERSAAITLTQLFWFCIFHTGKTMLNMVSVLKLH